MKIFILLSFIFFGVSCDAQTATNMPDKPIDPLVCDTQKGVCEMPVHNHQNSPTSLLPKQKSIRMIYFTDPICSACWSIEPQLRKLQMEYGEHIEVEYHMGGLLPSWDAYNGGGISKPSDVAHHWEEMSTHFDMPIDGSVWLEDPLPSSYPPCIAYKAAEIQDKAKAARFLRRIKEMVFMEKKNITKWEHLSDAAASCNLDTAKLRADYHGNAGKLFQEDLVMARQYGVRGFPAIYFTDSLNNRLTVYGFAPYTDFEQTLQKLAPGIHKNSIDTKPESLFAIHPTYTTKEFSSIAGVSKESAEKILSEMTTKGKISKYQSKNGALWKKK